MPPAEQTDDKQQQLTQWTVSDAAANNTPSSADDASTADEPPGDAPTSPPDETPDTISFAFDPDTLSITPSNPLAEYTVTALTSTSLAPPLSDTIEYLTHCEPQPTTDTDRIVRTLYIIGCAQLNALAGYDVRDSMIPVREQVEAELNVPVNALTDTALTEKQVCGREKYYGLTATGRQYLQETDHPDFGLKGAQTPVLTDGPVHNRAVLATAEALLAAQTVTETDTPHTDTEPPVDIAGYTDGTRTCLGEVIAAEDIADQRAQPLRDRLTLLDARPEQSLLVFESSPVAVECLTHLDRADVIDIPGDIEYRNYSIAQLQRMVLPELTHGAFSRIESLATLEAQQ